MRSLVLPKITNNIQYQDFKALGITYLITISVKFHPTTFSVILFYIIMYDYVTTFHAEW